MFKLPRTSRLEFLIFKFFSESERLPELLMFSTLTFSVIQALISSRFLGDTSGDASVPEFTFFERFSILIFSSCHKHSLKYSTKF